LRPPTAALRSYCLTHFFSAWPCDFHTNTHRFLPDKAIDLVDEAAAKLKMEITSKPEALDEIDRKVLQLEMERLSLQKVGLVSGLR
jgi:hypothetical protein